MPNRHFPTSNSHRTGRWLAITAVWVLLFGKLVHLGQEADDCCTSGLCVTAAPVETDDQQPSPCPFGCSHHDASEEKSEDREHGPEGHHDHNCSVCQVLSHITESPVVATPPEECFLVVETLAWSSESADAVTSYSARPRGPPAVA